MASTQEVGRLVVKLLGDASSYQKMLGTAIKKSAVAGKAMTRYLTLPILAVGGLAVKAFADFDQAMTESLSIMGDLGEGVKKEMRDVALELSTKSTKGPDELAKSYYFLASAGLSAKQSIAALPIVTKFATAGAFDMSLATDLLTDAQTALGTVLTESGKDMEDLGDHIVLAARQANASVQQFAESLTADAGVAARTFGMQIETTMAILGAYASSGKKAAEAGNLMGRATRLLTKASRDNADVFEKYNIKVIDDATGEYKNFIDIIRDMEQSFKDLTAPQVAQRLSDLGFEALAQKSILPLLGMSDAMKEWEEQQLSAAGTMEDVFQKQMKSFTNQMKMLWNQIKVTAIGIGSTLAPSIKSLSGFLKGMLEWWQKLNPAVQKFAVNFVLVVAAIGPALIIFSKLVSMSMALTAALQTSAIAAGAFNVALGTLAVVGIAMIIKGVYEANSAVKLLNEQMERSDSLTEKLNKRKKKIAAGVDATAEGLKGQEKIAYLKKQADMAGKEAAGARAQLGFAKQNEAKLAGNDRASRKGWGTGAVGGLWREMTGNKLLANARTVLAEKAAKAAKTAIRSVELKRNLELAITAEKKAQILIEREQAADALANKGKRSPLSQYLKSAVAAAKNTADKYSWYMSAATDKWKKKTVGAFANVTKNLGKTDQNVYRVNKAVIGGSMADYASREFSATFQADNKKEDKKEDTQNKQLEVLGKIETALKNNLRPFGGLQDLFEIVTG